jgi:hypothetical protein
MGVVGVAGAAGFLRWIPMFVPIAKKPGDDARG